MKKSVLYLLVVMLFFSLLPHTFFNQLYANETEKIQLVSIKKYDDYVKMLKNMKIIIPAPVQEESRYDTALDMSMADVQAPSAAVNTASSSTKASEHSTTNLQVADVDEADTLKNDSRYIYKLTDSHTIAIIDTVPTLKALGKIYDENINFSSMLLDGNKLITIGRQYNTLKREHPITINGSSRDTNEKEYTSVRIYDVTSKASPKLKREIKLEGEMISLRKINQQLYVITSGRIRTSYEDTYEKADIIPSFTDSLTNAKMQLADFNHCLSPDWNTISYYRQLPYTLAASIDLNGKQAISPYWLLMSVNDIYMNKNALFLSTAHSSFTYISRFNVNNGTLSYKATGRINGNLYNQFAMDEYNGYFRTASNAFSSHRESEITVFDKEMKQIGFLGNLAPDESIYSARFEGAKCYLVTYLNTDPLFVIDLSKPAQPKAAGYLKIPGVSYYLHPIAENLVVGIGLASPGESRGVSDIDIDGMSAPDNGIKLSLFDVSNAAKPKEINKIIVGDDYSRTPALDNHKAVTVHPSKKLLAIPVFLHFDPGRDLDDFGGAYVFGLENGKLVGKAKLGYVEDGKPSSSLYYYHNSDDDRVCFIGNKLYFLYSNQINAYELTSFHRIETIKLPGSSQNSYYPMYD